MKVLPESFRRCLSPQDRKALGQPTIEESKAKGTAKLERELQSVIVQDLRRRGFEVLWHRTDRKSTATVGWPDITFSHYGRSVAYEVKMPSGRLSTEQNNMLFNLESLPNGWTVAVIRSFDEYLAELHKLYVENPDGTRPATR